VNKDVLPSHTPKKVPEKILLKNYTTLVIQKQPKKMDHYYSLKATPVV